MSFMIEVIADDSGKWCGNGLRFSTEKEAEDYGNDLYSRWMLVREKRVVTSPDPVNYDFTTGVLQSVEKVQASS